MRKIVKATPAQRYSSNLLLGVNMSPGLLKQAQSGAITSDQYYARAVRVGIRAKNPTMGAAQVARKYRRQAAAVGLPVAQPKKKKARKATFVRSVKSPVVVYR